MASSVPAPPESEEEGEGESTVVAGAEELREALSRSAVHSVESVESVDAEDFGGLDPEQDEEQGVTNPPPGYTNGARPQPSAASFSYPDGLPFPPAPPRPALDPALRVTPAPRPN